MENPRLALPDGSTVPQLGFGTYQMAERAAKKNEEIHAIRLAVELGMNLIDTAEMYGQGKTETLVGEALRGIRDKVFLVSKVLPQNASFKGTIQACERSLKRLQTDCLDLYLLHWPSNHPIEDTVAAFDTLLKDGKIRRWGVSNFDTAEMKEVYGLPTGHACTTNQILYNVARRAPEFDLLPWMAEKRMPFMAYSPVEQGRLPATGALTDIARARGVSHFTIALAWILRRKDVMVIPKTSSEKHLRENHAALGITLDETELAAIDHSFKPPKRKSPLELL